MDKAVDEVPSDELIAEMMFDGKPEGICVLLNRFSGRVHFLLVQKFSPVLQDEDVKEVLAFAALKAFKSAHTFNAKIGNLGGWFYTIAHNTAIDFIRKGGVAASHEVPLEYDPAIEGRTVPSLEEDPTPSEIQAVSELEDAISLLPKMQQAILRADIAAGGRADDTWLSTRLKSSVNSIRVQRSTAFKTISNIRNKMLNRHSKKGGKI